MDEYILMQWTSNDLKGAKEILSDLLESKCIACGTIYPGVTSIYRWKDKIEESSECVIVMKTTKDLYDVIETYILENHPYVVPEIIAIPIQRGLRLYLEWIDQETS